MKICGHGTVLALTPCSHSLRFGVNYYAASQNQRDLLDSIALYEYQLKKAHEQGLKRSEVPPFLGLKRSDRSNDMPA